jgi:hypothetical protein
MSNAASQAAMFYSDVVVRGYVYTLRDASGYPAPDGDGGRAMPFWSSRTRVEKIIKTVPAYQNFEPVELELSTFIERWLPGLERDGLKVGVNWSGPRASGHDVEPQNVRIALDNELKKRASQS